MGKKEESLWLEWEERKTNDMNYEQQPAADRGNVLAETNEERALPTSSSGVFNLLLQSAGPWKKKNLHEEGIVTQCIAPTKISDQYLTNVLLKINSKAFRHLDKEEELPKFTFLVAQKNHHTKLFQAGSTENVPPVAPVCYAHLAASQMSQFVKFEDSSDSSSWHGSVTAAGTILVPELPRLHPRISRTMFFC
ncbi:hypothetical protein MRB53_010360 [Persea americana]|uniref:Uncharacterized protein n=1 Tax=Persea americana TaxID=3435 RepID=A0ACC2LSC4_PERAE|nr:hypothetical protein MRB53_010360 [Persea americana]